MLWILSSFWNNHCHFNHNLWLQSPITSTAFIHTSILRVSGKERITRQNRWDMEIKSLKLWNVICFITLSVIYCFSTQCVCTERKLKSKKKTAAQGLYFERWKKGGDWTLLLGNEPIVRFSILMHWPSPLPMNCWSIDFLRWLCCPLCIVFCVEFYTGLYVFNRQATVRPRMHSSFGFD